MHNFTPEDLVQYLYNETSPQKTEAIKAALETDWHLKEMHDVIVSAQKRLEAFELRPREESLSKILWHAKKAIAELHTH
ncbi:MAG TPA: hypothetical protein VGP43_11220 [Chitinophagaceae bacterium]|nr:hypothetical protein [Chitinophagaceae bacterium]